MYSIDRVSLNEAFPKFWIAFGSVLVLHKITSYASSHLSKLTAVWFICNLLSTVDSVSVWCLTAPYQNIFLSLFF